MTRTIDTLRAAMPGLLLSATIALAVRFISDRLGGPAMLYALLFGMAFNFLTEDERFASGIRYVLVKTLQYLLYLLKANDTYVITVGVHPLAQRFPSSSSAPPAGPSEPYSLFVGSDDDAMRTPVYYVQDKKRMHSEISKLPCKLFVTEPHKDAIPADNAELRSSCTGIQVDLWNACHDAGLRNVEEEAICRAFANYEFGAEQHISLLLAKRETVSRSAAKRNAELAHMEVVSHDTTSTLIWQLKESQEDLLRMSDLHDVAEIALSVASA